LATLYDEDLFFVQESLGGIGSGNLDATKLLNAFFDLFKSPQ